MGLRLTVEFGLKISIKTTSITTTMTIRLKWYISNLPTVQCRSIICLYFHSEEILCIMPISDGFDNTRQKNKTQQIHIQRWQKIKPKKQSTEKLYGNEQSGMEYVFIWTVCCRQETQLFFYSCSLSLCVHFPYKISSAVAIQLHWIV